MHVEELTAERIDDLEPLWSELREHHGEVGEVDLPVRIREDSWAIRRGHYADWLGREEGFGFVARDDDGRAIGYAMVHVMGPGATLQTGPRVADVETLSVASGARGQGIGSALLEAVEARLRELGISDVVIGVMAGNDDARRLYEKLGFKPFVTELIKRL
jgi:ribosomal protein S18 acetylase RimI-like enzyme